MRGMHHVSITTGCFDRAVRMYREGLGFTVKHTWGRDQKVCMLDAGDGVCVELTEGRPGTHAGGGPFGNGQWMHLALRTEDIRRDYQRALDAGFQGTLPPTYADILEAEPKPVSLWFAYLTGCDGEQIELIQELDGQK